MSAKEPHGKVGGEERKQGRARTSESTESVKLRMNGSPFSVRACMRDTSAPPWQPAITSTQS